MGGWIKRLTGLISSFGWVLLLMIVVTLVLTSVSVIQRSANMVSAQDRTLSKQTHARYDDKSIRGDEVIQTIDNAENPIEYKLQITVVNGSNTSIYGWTSQSDTTFTNYDTSTDVNDVTWINPSANYSAELDTSNNAVVGYTFTLN